jgi:hypothetical protein
MGCTRLVNEYLMNDKEQESAKFVGSIQMLQKLKCRGYAGFCLKTNKYPGELLIPTPTLVIT